MEKLTELCAKYFGTKNLYEVLNVKKEANDNEIKRGYYKASLKVHPDRVNETEKDRATEKFQVVGKVYNILNDEKKRKIYNDTGEVDDTVEYDSDINWEDYWRILFPQLDLSKIKEFEEKYKESEEELEDLKRTYEIHKGDMNLIMESIMCATLNDEERFTNILMGLIEAGDLPSFPAFTDEPKSKKQKRRKKMLKEAVEAEKESKKMGLDKSANDLTLMIQQRQEQRKNQMDGFFSHLEEKYCQEKSSSSLKRKGSVNLNHIEPKKSKTMAASKKKTGSSGKKLKGKK